MTTHIVALSGGKDSTAMALRLQEVEPQDYLFVCTPTGDELPEMFAHWNRLSELLGTKILPVMAGITLNARIQRQMHLPNARQRWCTRELKIEPFKRFLFAHAPAVSYVGLRADEEEREGAIYGDITGITQRYPLREWGWGVNDVWDYLEARGVVIPKRTDCARCFFQTLPEWYLLWKQHPDKYAEAEAQEATVSAHRGKDHTFRSDSRDTWPAGLAGLRAEFERGRIPKGLANHLQLRLNSTDRPMMCRACKL